MRTVIYARYSSTLQQASSIADQVAACRARCAAEGWPILGIYQDAAISGAAGIDDVQRPGLAAMLSAIEAGGIDQVLAESTDRIARHLGDSVAIRERLTFAGARLFTLNDGEVSDLIGGVKGAIDAHFRKELGAKIRRGQRGAVERGRAPAGLAYGYARVARFDDRGDPIRGLRAIDEAQAAIVRRIFREFVAGQSARAIAIALNADGIPSPRGGKWTDSTIRGDAKRGNGILKNRLYVGELIVNRTSKLSNPATRRSVIRSNAESEWAVQSTPDLAIVDRPTWDAAQALMTLAPGRPVAHLARRPRKLLSGLVRCGVCGAPARVVNAGYWGCAGHDSGSGCTNVFRAGNDRLEATVLGHLSAQLLDPDLVAHYVKTYHEDYARRVAELSRDRGSLERKAAELDRKIARFVAAIGAGGAFDEINEALATAKAERATIRDRLTVAQSLPVVRLHPGIADDYRRQVAALGEALDGHREAQIEAVPRLRALIDHVALWPAKPGERGARIETTAKIAALLELSAAPAQAPGSIPTKRTNVIG